MKVGIMQPYFLPYIGYFQLLNAVDKYIIYDDIQYTKKGWINRNKILQNDKDIYITLSLSKDSDYLNIVERSISESFDKKKLLNLIKDSYRKAPYIDSVLPVIEKIINYDNNNLFEYLLFSIKEIAAYLNITTPIIISSTLVGIDKTLKGQEKVLEICKKVGATNYINAIGGLELYSKEIFLENGISLCFLQTESISYNQLNKEFIPYLSIIDVMMFNSLEEINVLLDKFELI